MTYIAATGAAVEGMACSSTAVADGCATTAVGGEWDSAAGVAVAACGGLTAYSSAVLALFEEGGSGGEGGEGGGEEEGELHDDG